jgi:16S rRNA (cytidine1402-2'-O)-methyltransferase
MVGPSSILLALMASGLSGQRFTFHGYLPVEDAQRAQWIAQSQRSSASLQQSQIAIETPYRNQALFKALCEHLDGQTVLCIASEIRGPKQTISSRTIDQWRRLAPVLDKQATLFLWQAQAISAGGKSRSEQPPFLRQSSRRRV